MLEIALLIAVGVALLAHIVFWSSPGFLLVLGFIVWSMGFTWILGVPRALAVSGGLILIAASIFKLQRENGSSRRPHPVAYFPLAMAVLGIVLIPWATYPEFPQSVVALGVLTLLAARTIPAELLTRSAFVATSFLAALNFALLLLRQPEAYLAGRFQGIAENPNGLGSFTFLWVALSFGISRRAVLIVTPLATILAVASGSRGGTLALIAAVAAGVWVGGLAGRRGRGRWVARILLGVTLVSLAWYIHRLFGGADSALSDAALLRTIDSSRVDVAAESWSRFLEKPLTGWGMGQTDLAFEAHVQPVTIAYQVGVIGLVLFFALAVTMVLTRWRHSPALAALVFGSLVAWTAESWILSTSDLALIFWMALATLTSQSLNDANEPPPWSTSTRATHSVDDSSGRSVSIR